jgi:hypothetical protein
MEKRRKIVAHHLFEYEVTAVRVLVTKRFSAVNFANYVEYKLHFLALFLVWFLTTFLRNGFWLHCWWCDSAVHLMWQCCPNDVRVLFIWCDSAVYLMWQCCPNDLTVLFIWCDSAVYVMQQCCWHDATVLLTWCNSPVDHATVPWLMWWHCWHDATALLIVRKCCRWCDGAVDMMQQRCYTLPGVRVLHSCVIFKQTHNRAARQMPLDHCDLVVLLFFPIFIVRTPRLMYCAWRIGWGFIFTL